MRPSIDPKNVFQQRREQAQAEESRKERAEREMRMRTIMQGRELTYNHIKSIVDELTPESWRIAAGIVCPNWLHKAWFNLLKAMLLVARGLWFALSFLLLYQPLRRLSLILQRGGHVGKVYNGPKEWVVQIKIFKWWKQVYKCDFDVRNGSVSEVIKGGSNAVHGEKN